MHVIFCLGSVYHTHIRFISFANNLMHVCSIVMEVKRVYRWPIVDLRCTVSYHVRKPCGTWKHGRFR